MSGPGPGIEEPVRAKVKTAFNPREIELIMCCSRGNVAKFKRLLKFGAVVKLLIRKGADPNIVNFEGIAPLHVACLRGHSTIAQMLLHAGADTDTAPPTALSEPSSSARPDKQPRATETRSPLEAAKDELVREILRKLDQHNLESLEGIRLMVEVRATDIIDSLCGLYNRLAGIERQKERARRRKVRHKPPSIGVKAMPPDTVPTFAPGQKLNLSAEAVEGEIKRHLPQAHHRFVSQAVNDMEFGRGKSTTGYPGMWSASAGISAVGSCSVFFYADEETQVIRIVGIGHHAGRAACRLDYAVEGLGGSGRILCIA